MNINSRFVYLCATSQQLHMNQSIQLFIKSSILDRERQLTVTNDFIEFDNTEFSSETPIKLLKSDITGLRHGVKWINGYQFVIGRIYCIDLLSSNSEILKIRSKSVYGIRKKS